MDPHDAIRPLLDVRQVRAFSTDPIDEGAVDAILDAARWSGSRENRQPWRFVVVREAERRDQLVERLGPGRTPLTGAPVVVAIVLPKEEGASISNAFDEGRATERILAAATLVGLGGAIAWVASENRPAVGELLGVPDGRFVRTLVAVGVPADDAPADRERLPRHEVVSVERHGPG